MLTSITVGSFDLALAAVYSHLLLQHMPWTFTFGAIGVITAIVAYNYNSMDFDHVNEPVEPAVWFLLCSIIACYIGLDVTGSGLYAASGSYFLYSMYNAMGALLAMMIISCMAICISL